MLADFSHLSYIHNPLGALWESSGISLGILWESSGSPLGALWEPSGNPLGALWEPAGNPMGALREPSGNSYREKNHLVLGDETHLVKTEYKCVYLFTISLYIYVHIYYILFIPPVADIFQIMYLQMKQHLRMNTVFMLTLHFVTTVY